MLSMVSSHTQFRVRRWRHGAKCTRRAQAHERRGKARNASGPNLFREQKLTTPNEVLAIQIPVMPVPVSEVAAAPRGCIRCGGVRPAPLAAVALAADGPGPAAELAALQAQLAALKAAVGAAVRTREPPRPVKSINARVTVTPVTCQAEAHTARESSK